jgi:acyl-CoA thioesterase I
MTKRRDCIATLLALAGAALLPQTASASQVATPSTARSATRRWLIVGDSLSAEYGLHRGSGWVALSEQRLQREGPTVEVINASISGDTTAGGRARLGALLTRHRPTHVTLELGGNDALRGLPLAQTEDNLRNMIRQCRQAGAQVMLVGMQVPPNYGTDYTRQFAALFQSVARSERTALVPFLLAGIADRPDALKWFQPDRIHPIEAAHPKIVETIWPTLRPWLSASSPAR